MSKRVDDKQDRRNAGRVKKTTGRERLLAILLKENPLKKSKPKDLFERSLR